MKIKATVFGRAGENKEIDVEIPYYCRVIEPTTEGVDLITEGNSFTYMKIEADKTTKIKCFKQWGGPEIYHVKVEEKVMDWENPLHCFYLRKKQDKSTARRFELAHKRALKWSVQQLRLLKSIQA